MIDNFMLNVYDKVKNIKEGTVEAIEVIGELSKAILDGIDWIATTIMNPVILLTAIDKLSLVVITSLLVLKMLGFKNLEKWILLGVLLKVVAMVFL